MGPEQKRLIQDVGLTLKRDTQTRHLSGEPEERGRLRGGGALRLTQVGKGGCLANSWVGLIRTVTLSAQVECSENCLWPLPLWVAFV